MYNRKGRVCFGPTVSGKPLEVNLLWANSMPPTNQPTNPASQPRWWQTPWRSPSLLAPAHPASRPKRTARTARTARQAPRSRPMTTKASWRSRGSQLGRCWRVLGNPTIPQRGMRYLISQESRWGMTEPIAKICWMSFLSPGYQHAHVDAPKILTHLCLGSLKQPTVYTPHHHTSPNLISHIPVLVGHRY